MESGEERDGAGKGGGELLRGSHYPHPRSGPLDSRAPAGLFNPQRVALNRGSAARWAQRKRGREEPRKGEGGTHLKRRDRAPGDPRDRVTGFSWRAWECRGNRPVLSADERGAGTPNPTSCSPRVGGKCPSCSCGRVWERSASAARTLAVPVSRGLRRSALLRALGPRGPTAPVLASPAQSEQVQELGTPWTTLVHEASRGRSGPTGLILVFIPLRGCTLS